MLADRVRIGVNKKGFGICVVGGKNGKLVSTSDGITWTEPVTEFGTAAVYGLAYGNGLFVAVGYDGRVMTSPDGITWTTRIPSGWTLITVTYANGLFLAGGLDGTLITSPDGITWTTRNSTLGTSALENSIRGITYGNGMYIATGGGAVNGDIFVITSPDGITWTKQTLNIEGGIGIGGSNGVAYNDGMLVSLPYVGVFSSPDGITWTKRSDYYSLANIIYAEGSFRAVGRSRIIMSSLNGITWTSIYLSSSEFVSSNITDIIYANGFWVVVGDDGAISISDDLSTFAPVTSGVTDDLLSIAFKGDE